MSTIGREIERGAGTATGREACADQGASFTTELKVSLYEYRLGDQVLQLFCQYTPP
jgi:hypothetical protein